MIKAGKWFWISIFAAMTGWMATITGFWIQNYQLFIMGLITSTLFWIIVGMYLLYLFQIRALKRHEGHMLIGINRIRSINDKGDYLLDCGCIVRNVKTPMDRVHRSYIEINCANCRDHDCKAMKCAEVFGEPIRKGQIQVGFEGGVKTLEVWEYTDNEMPKDHCPNCGIGVAIVNVNWTCSHCGILHAYEGYIDNLKPLEAPPDNENDLLGKVPCPKCGRDVLIRENGNQAQCHHMWGSIKDKYPDIARQIMNIRNKELTNPRK